MKKSADIIRSGAPVCAIIACILAISNQALAAPWGGIQPFKSRRVDVVKILGEPAGESPDGVLRFNVMGGSVQVSFVSEKFVAAKKLRPELVGTVLEIVLQHDRAAETPESLKLVSNKAYTRDETENTLIFRNLKDGLVYTFMRGTLRTTRYTFADDQLAKARKY
jgi:hypothetical protein